MKHVHPYRGRSRLYRLAPRVEQLEDRAAPTNLFTNLGAVAPVFNLLGGLDDPQSLAGARQRTVRFPESLLGDAAHQLPRLSSQADTLRVGGKLSLANPGDITLASLQNPFPEASERLFEALQSADALLRDPLAATSSAASKAASSYDHQRRQHRPEWRSGSHTWSRSKRPRRVGESATGVGSGRCCRQINGGPGQ